MERKGKQELLSTMTLLYKINLPCYNNFCGGSNDAVVSGTSQSLQFNNQVSPWFSTAVWQSTNKQYILMLSVIIVARWLFQDVVTLLKDAGHNLEDAGCDLATVWKMQAVTWLPSRGCRLWLGCCLEDVGVSMQWLSSHLSWYYLTMTWYIPVTWPLSEECGL